jgi:hemerythrin
MPFMQWDTSFELGIKEFDDHHKHLVHLLNLTYDAITLGAGRVEIGTVLNELVDYSVYHFAAEEQWMIDRKYPGLPEHVAEHVQFVKWIFKTQEDFLIGNMRVGRDVMEFLNTWLTDHILVTDAGYKSYAREADVDNY